MLRTAVRGPDMVSIGTPEGLLIIAGGNGTPIQEPAGGYAFYHTVDVRAVAARWSAPDWARHLSASRCFRPRTREGLHFSPPSVERFTSPAWSAVRSELACVAIASLIECLARSFVARTCAPFPTSKARAAGMRTPCALSRMRAPVPVGRTPSFELATTVNVLPSSVERAIASLPRIQSAPAASFVIPQM